jgi:hypothetical protein
MHEDLRKLTEELSKETCPPRVLERLRERISAGKSETHRLWFMLSGATAAFAILFGLVVWRWPAEPNSKIDRQTASRPAASNDRAQLAMQTATALEFVGATLVNAGERSEKAIFMQAVPQLRNSLENASKKTIDRLKL